MFLNGIGSVRLLGKPVHVPTQVVELVQAKSE